MESVFWFAGPAIVKELWVGRSGSLVDLFRVFEQANRQVDDGGAWFMCSWLER